VQLDGFSYQKLMLYQRKDLLSFRNNLLRCAASLLLATFVHAHAATARPPDKDYVVYFVCEAADKVVVARYGPKGLHIDKQISVAELPNEINGPHGITLAHDHQYYYVSMAHGRPLGSLWKFRVSNDTVVTRTPLGMFPATADLTPDGDFAYIVNFNLHGDMVPSSVSVVDTDSMIEVARILTCTMPHGSRLNPQGTRQYSACMMDDLLVEIDTQNFRVSRRFMVSKGTEKGETLPPGPMIDARKNVEAAPMPMHHHEADCSPTWAQPSADGSSVFVACNKSSEIVEIDTRSWTLRRRIPAGPGVYNLAVSHNGLLLATNKRGPSVSVFEIATGKELARIPLPRKNTHGVIVSPDDRYAFVTAEGVGAEPGTLMVVDLETLQPAATLDAPEQAAGIDFFTMEPPH
jgi:DNA-binding beta-propeller fold protein YncE